MKSDNFSFLVTVFVTGASVLVLEVSAVRLLSPIFGSSLHVLSSVLTTILLALSVGYWFGGKKSDNGTSILYLYNTIILSGVSILLLLVLNKFVLSNIEYIKEISIGPLLYSLILFFIPAFLLGIVSPYVIKIQSLRTSIENIGMVVGSIFFWGTIGSIFGSLISGYVLIPLFGITHVITLTGFTLILLGFLMQFKFKVKQSNFSYLTLFIIIFFLLFLIRIDYSNNNFFYSIDGLYSSINLMDVSTSEGDIRLLLRDKNFSSGIYLNSKKILFPNVRFNILYDNLFEHPKDALILGGGAYNAPRTLTYLDPDLKIDVVEIEPILFEVAQEYFDLDDISNISNFTMDARVFLQNESYKKYDYIFGDVFGTDSSIPFHLTTKEFYFLIKNHLNKDGIFILNTVGKIDADEPSMIGSIYKTLNSVFSNIKIYGFDKNMSNTQNVIFVIRNGEEEIKISNFNLMNIDSAVYELSGDIFNTDNEILLTDDHAPVEYLINKKM